VSAWITEIERAEMSPTMTAGFARMAVQIEHVRADHADTDRDRDGAEHAE
jgi:hypothetical protein